MTLGTLVVEAATRSGLLITARLALEQNREVMAVPGSPVDPRAAGTNGLLKQGARIVTEPGDVLDALGPDWRQPSAPSRPAREPDMADCPAPDPAEGERDRILEALGPAPVEIDEIVRFTGLPARLVQIVLLELDLAGRIERHPGGRVSLT
jgi:DNA processing protein